MQEHPLTIDDDSNGSRSQTASPTSMINNYNGLSVSVSDLGMNINQEQEKKLVLRLTSPSLNEYELNSHGLPISPALCQATEDTSNDDADIEENEVYQV